MVTIYQIHTSGTILAWLRRALVDIDQTIAALIARRASTLVATLDIDTSTAIPAGRIQMTLIDIMLTMLTLVAR